MLGVVWGCGEIARSERGEGKRVGGKELEHFVVDDPHQGFDVGEDGGFEEAFAFVTFTALTDSGTF